MLLRSIRAAGALAGLTYVGSHGYLAYHLVYGKKVDPVTKVASDSVPISAQKDRQHIVDAVVGLYQLRYSNDKMEAYAKNAVFEDPFARLESRKALAAGMNMMLSTFKKSDTLHLNVLHGQDSIVVELTQEYTLRGLGIKMQVPSVIYLKLTGPPGGEQILEHIEEWGGKELLRANQGNHLGGLSEKLRTLNGKVSTALFPVPEGFAG